jgi:hypothetical protein
LQLVRAANQPAGEVPCSHSSGYAIGSDIGFPGSTPILQRPAGANPAFAPFLGRWEGDDEYGAYVIMESVGVGPTHLVFEPASRLRPDSPQLSVRSWAIIPLKRAMRLGRSSSSFPTDSMVSG